ncbi:unnamed protein product [Rotaria socialis]|nr:unnamed protein product [Rotaria socialis]
MKNKFGNNIKLVKIELTSYEIRRQLLADKKLIINYISYDIDQYLAPINVLICSKCCGLGHFRKQCVELTETCRTCSGKFTDLKDHRCTASPKCKHCNGDYTSNSMKCPVVKSFRADLTRKILSNSNSINRPLLPTVSTKSNNGFHFNPPNFPALNKGWSQSDSPMMSKLNDLLTGLANVNTTLSKLYETNTKFEKFMADKNIHDIELSKEVESLKLHNTKLEEDMRELNSKTDQHADLLKQVNQFFKRLLLPAMDGILKGCTETEYSVSASLGLGRLGLGRLGLGRLGRDSRSR